MGNTWKTIAIIVIIVLVVENLLFFWIFSIGTNVIKKETQCGEVICQDYEAYLYDSLNEICNCYIDNEVVHKEVMK